MNTSLPTFRLSTFLYTSEKGLSRNVTKSEDSCRYSLLLVSSKSCSLLFTLFISPPLYKSKILNARTGKKV
jgi:hypothetical protein